MQEIGNKHDSEGITSAGTSPPTEFSIEQRLASIDKSLRTIARILDSVNIPTMFRKKIDPTKEPYRDMSPRERSSI